MGWLAKLLSTGTGRGKARPRTAAKPDRAPKRTTTRKVTKEWRHGSCPVRHKTRRAALRCRNP